MVFMAHSLVESFVCNGFGYIIGAKSGSGTSSPYTWSAMTEKDNRLTGRSYLVYLLPFLHLVACFAMWLDNVRNLEPMILIDCPSSIPVVGLVYAGFNPWIWFGVLGTLWWYLLSLAIRWGIGFIANPKRN